MKAFLSIIKSSPEGRVEKFQDFDTLAEAEAHSAEFKDQFPDAFAAPTPDAPFTHWFANPSGRTVTIKVPTPEPPTPDPDASLHAAIMASNTLEELKLALVGQPGSRSVAGKQK